MNGECHVCVTKFTAELGVFCEEGGSLSELICFGHPPRQEKGVTN